MGHFWHHLSLITFPKYRYGSSVLFNLTLNLLPHCDPLLLLLKVNINSLLAHRRTVNVWLEQI